MREPRRSVTLHAPSVRPSVRVSDDILLRFEITVHTRTVIPSMLSRHALETGFLKRKTKPLSLVTQQIAFMNCFSEHVKRHIYNLCTLLLDLCYFYIIFDYRTKRKAIYI